MIVIHLAIAIARLSFVSLRKPSHDATSTMMQAIGASADAWNIAKRCDKLFTCRITRDRARIGFQVRRAEREKASRNALIAKLSAAAGAFRVAHDYGLAHSNHSSRLS